MDYDALINRLRDPQGQCHDVGATGVCFEITDADLCDDAADAITKLRAERDALRTKLHALESPVVLSEWQKLVAERDALQVRLIGFDAAREMLNVQDNYIDKLCAALRIARSAIYSLDAREIYADELASIDAVLANGKP